VVYIEHDVIHTLHVIQLLNTERQRSEVQPDTESTGNTFTTNNYSTFRKILAFKCTLMEYQSTLSPTT